MSATCSAIKRDGSPCTLPSNGSGDLCWAHNPANKEKRLRGQRRGGRNKPSRELVDLKSRLTVLAEDVLAGRVDRSNAAVAGQLYNVVLRAIETERRLRETEDLARQVEELSELLDARSDGGRRWG